jgi:hypothetical protein
MSTDAVRYIYATFKNYSASYLMHIELECAQCEVKFIHLWFLSKIFHSLASVSSQRESTSNQECG